VLEPDLAKYRYVHLATHGIFNSDQPHLSGLVFSLLDEKGKAVDGFLRLNDIYNMRLSADVVVLSACQTALGADVRGEGLIGLTRGFMYAGASRVVASLWQVDDASTVELMRRFYQGMMRDTLSPVAALQRAQRDMARDSRWSSPFYWAAFVLQGEWR
jgi:CHAT domain-containing protein